MSSNQLFLFGSNQKVRRRGSIRKGSVFSELVSLLYAFDSSEQALFPGLTLQIFTAAKPDPRELNETIDLVAPLYDEIFGHFVTFIVD
ncbi:hypothetical protein [Acanthopleuribacter pedis]|uniref:Uncharacterized protein n=1 Tax=Acanthopleuribacter pedis TaxID=442870 RepID=A0A8J7QKD5_9BACT|nr:hypothetical protein [Acanthopleuribacter pedis]MBO1321560.1 hypothetical protein [Acanthopleuribacter pedis]